MNITQSYVSLFFWLGSCQLDLKVFHWERKFCLFLISAVFSILEVYIYLNSVLLVFCFCFCFLFFLGDKHGCLISEISTWRGFCLKTTIWISRTVRRRHSENISSQGHFPWPSTDAVLRLIHFLNGQCSARYPCLIRLHTRPPHIKRKNKKKKLRNHMAI